jgi:hypothetical protein
MKTGILSLPAVALVWFGVVAAIAIEAGVKFTAPSLTRAVGLDVGRHVFAAINKVEIGLGVLALVGAALRPPPGWVLVTLGVVVVALALQTAWLLPGLADRAARAISGESLPPSHLHVAYVAAEGVKLLALLVTAHGALSAAARPAG